MSIVLLLVIAASSSDKFDLNVDALLKERAATAGLASSPSFSARPIEEVLEQHLTLDSFLLYVPGFDESPGGLQNSPAVRGIPGSLSLLIDGVVTNSAYDYHVTTNEGLFLEEFDRLEITTGPAGVLWGAYSLLGTVNVLNDDTERPRTAVKLTAGTSSFQRISLKHVERLGDGQLKLFVGFASRRGVSPEVSGGWAGVPPYALAYVPTDASPEAPQVDQHLVLTARYSTQHFAAYVRIPLSNEHYQVSELGGVLAPGAPEQRKSNAALAYISGSARLAKPLILYSRASWVRNNEVIERRLFASSPALIAPAHDRVQYDLHRFTGLLEVRHRLELSSVRNDLSLGSDATLETLRTSNYFQAASGTDDALVPRGRAFRDATDLTASAYAFDELSLWNRISLGGGARYNFGGSVYKDVLLAQGGASLRLYNDNSVRVAYTQGMRPPQFPDREGIAPVRGTFLKPERSSSLLGEVIAAHDFPSFGKLSGRAALSRSLVDDIIGRDGNIASPFTQRPSNGVGFIINSVESSGRWANPDNTRSVDVTYRYNKVADSRVADGEQERQLAAALNYRCGIGACANSGPRHRGTVALRALWRDALTTIARAHLQCGGTSLVAANTGVEQATLPLGLVSNARVSSCYGAIDLVARMAMGTSGGSVTAGITNIGDTRRPTILGVYPELRGAAPQVEGGLGRLAYISVEVPLGSAAAW